MSAKRNRPVHDNARLFIQLEAMAQLTKTQSIIRLENVYSLVESEIYKDDLGKYDKDAVKRAVRGVMRNLCNTAQAYHIGGDYYDVTVFYFAYRIEQSKKTVDIMLKHGGRTEITDRLVDEIGSLQDMMESLPLYPEKKSRVRKAS